MKVLPSWGIPKEHEAKQVFVQSAEAPNNDFIFIVNRGRRYVCFEDAGTR